MHDAGFLIDFATVLGVAAVTGWLFRLLSEPRRLLGRYIKYNALFLWYLLWDGLRGKAMASAEVNRPKAGGGSP